MDERQYTAIHEAGHAVAAVVLGLPIECASMALDGAAGEVRLILPSDNPEDLRPKAADYVVFYLAGGIAGRNYLKEAGFTSDESDERLARDLQTDFETIDIMGNELRWHPPLGPYIQRAEELVRDHRIQINRVACALKNMGKLNQQEVINVMNFSA
jgi:ATP-dependent Zn protease